MPICPLFISSKRESGDPGGKRQIGVEAQSIGVEVRAEPTRAFFGRDLSSANPSAFVSSLPTTCPGRLSGIWVSYRRRPGPLEEEGCPDPLPISQSHPLCTMPIPTAVRRLSPFRARRDL